MGSAGRTPPVTSDTRGLGLCRGEQVQMLIHWAPCSAQWRRWDRLAVGAGLNQRPVGAVRANTGGSGSRYAVKYSWHRYRLGRWSCRRIPGDSDCPHCVARTFSVLFRASRCAFPSVGESTPLSGGGAHRAAVKIACATSTASPAGEHCRGGHRGVQREHHPAYHHPVHEIHFSPQDCRLPA